MRDSDVRGSDVRGSDVRDSERPLDAGARWAPKQRLFASLVGGPGEPWTQRQAHKQPDMSHSRLARQQSDMGHTHLARQWQRYTPRRAPAALAKVFALAKVLRMSPDRSSCTRIWVQRPSRRLTRPGARA